MTEIAPRPDVRARAHFSNVSRHVPDAHSVSVVICCYTELRRKILTQAIDAVLAQLEPDDELILVVDGNAPLYGDLSARYGGRTAVIENRFQRGLSGARNSGLKTAVRDIIVFLDDDAVLEPAGLDGVRSAFSDATVTALGGAVHPDWHAGTKPAWFPPEFGWVVGCDYRGLPADGSVIRNPIGAAMAVRRADLDEIGGFSDRLGRIGSLPTGCEETMMGIELSRRDPRRRIVRRTSFAVSHAVPHDRTTVSYFLRRCYHEGRSKAVLTRLCDRRSSLQSERAFATKTLPTGLWQARRRPSRMLALIAGLMFTAAGYLVVLLGLPAERKVVP